MVNAEVATLDISDLLEMSNEELALLLSGMPEEALETVRHEVNEALYAPTTQSTSEYHSELNRVKRQALETIRGKHLNREFIPGNQ